MESLLISFPLELAKPRNDFRLQLEFCLAVSRINSMALLLSWDNKYNLITKQTWKLEEGKVLWIL